MARIRTVPNLGWKTDDDPTRAAHALHRIVGADSAFLLYGDRFWVVRYLDPRDKWHVDINGHRREQQPWRRKLEILACGKTLDECVFYLRGGHVKAMIGHGFTPIRDKRTGEWAGFRAADGQKFMNGLPLIGEGKAKAS